MARGSIIVFSAPSGAGKTTLLDHLRGALPGLVYSISATTRKARPHEVEGVHYFFLTVPEFRRRIGLNEFAEWQEVHGNLYGTPRSFVDQTVAAGRHIVMDIDVYGKKQFDRCYPEARGILVLPPSADELERRLRARSTDSDEAIALRLANSRRETEFAQTEGRYEYTVTNDDLERAKIAVEAIVREIIGAELPHG